MGTLYSINITSTDAVVVSAAHPVMQQSSGTCFIVTVDKVLLTVEEQCILL
jgi:hypothetical protein